MRKILCAGPKHFDQLKSSTPARTEKPDPTYNYALRLPRWRWPVMRLWRYVYGDVVVWCCNTRKFLVFNHAKLPKIEYKSRVISSALCNNRFVRIWIFRSTSFEKTNIETVWTLRTICAWLCIIACQRMSG